MQATLANVLRNRAHYCNHFLLEQQKERFRAFSETLKYSCTDINILLIFSNMYGLILSTVSFPGVRIALSVILSFVLFDSIFSALVASKISCKWFPDDCIKNLGLTSTIWPLSSLADPALFVGAFPSPTHSSHSKAFLWFSSHILFEIKDFAEVPQVWLFYWF